MRSASAHARRSPCRTAHDVHTRLATGAKTVILDSPPETTIELHDLPDGLTLRVEGSSRVQITDTTVRSEQRGPAIVITGAAHAQLFGHVRAHAYTTATVDAFDHTRVTAHNRAAVSAVDHAHIYAGENTTVYAYDHAAVHAHGDAQVHATDSTRIVLHGNAHAAAARGVTIFGPARGNVTVAAR
ncbi:hypothetical protein [Rhodococcus sp. T7]|uniref:hypothetical protein n=1 Tax=Rhodococcus sp. T7 TaxID=627444 RepID=UPI001359DB29|nr:hypothetical protein [Rhodococcus sp. T7]KAF0957036.1 hypothetical protein MLGJGCBP_10116 [Rhodococcus sp. T7]KAF0965715.1 hypothetical protein MLGJGCBP_01141 [Rhodococcus sp. T7]